jgi:hypothetical protein
VPVSVADAFEALAADGMLAVSDHLRLALVSYLQHLAVNTPAASRPTQQNGQQQEHTHGV